MDTRRVAALVMLVLATGCDLTQPDAPGMDELASARARWAREEPSSYVYTLERTCFCGVEARGPVVVTVVEGVVVQRSYEESGETVAPGFAELFPSVDGLFDFVEAAMRAEAARIDVTYDPETGVPGEIWVDADEHVADEEVGYVVRSAPSGS